MQPIQLLKLTKIIAEKYVKEYVSSERGSFCHFYNQFNSFITRPAETRIASPHPKLETQRPLKCSSSLTPVILHAAYAVLKELDATAVKPNLIQLQQLVKDFAKVMGAPTDKIIDLVERLPEIILESLEREFSSRHPEVNQNNLRQESFNKLRYADGPPMTKSLQKLSLDIIGNKNIVSIDGAKAAFQRQSRQLLFELVRREIIDASIGFLVFDRWKKWFPNPQRDFEAAISRLRTELRNRGVMDQDMPLENESYCETAVITKKLRAWRLKTTNIRLAGGIVEARESRKEAENAVNNGKISHAFELILKSRRLDPGCLLGATTLLKILPKLKYMPKDVVGRAIVQVLMSRQQIKTLISSADEKIQDHNLWIEALKNMLANTDNLIPEDRHLYLNAIQVQVEKFREAITIFQRTHDPQQIDVVLLHPVVKEAIINIAARLRAIYRDSDNQELQRYALDQVRKDVFLGSITFADYENEKHLQRSLEACIGINAVETMGEAYGLGTRQEQQEMRDVMKAGKIAAAKGKDVTVDSLVAILGSSWTANKVSESLDKIQKYKIKGEYESDESDRKKKYPSINLVEYMATFSTANGK